MNTIEVQRLIADKLLDKLEIIDPSCIIAGGAPRDWYLGREASDLDVFIHLRPDLNWNYLNKQLRRVLPEVSFCREEFRKELPEMYKKNPHIRAVLNFTYEGEKCQLIVMNKPTFKCVVEEFPLSICKVWYSNSRIHQHIDFERSIRHKAIVLTNKLYAGGSKYLVKINNKFPEYRYFVSWEELAKDLLDRGNP